MSTAVGKVARPTSFAKALKMQPNEALEKRGTSLEEAFFQKQNADLLEKLRQQRMSEVTKDDIAAATGIRDDALLERLVSMEVNLHTLTALSVVPLVEVAWADDRMEKNERDAVLQAADEAGIPKHGPGYQLLSQWLAEKPDMQLLACWKDYIAALAATFDADAYAQVRDNLLQRARQVATSAGGILGLGSISSTEQNKLAELEAAFKK